MNEHTRRYLRRLRYILGCERVAYILRAGRCTDNSEMARAFDLLTVTQAMRRDVRIGA